MKIRNGFVSNSSSSSFLIIAQSHIPDSIELRLMYLSKSYHYGYSGRKIYDYEQELYKYIEEPDILADNPTKPEYNYQRIYVNFPKEINYNRGDIMELTSIGDKIKYCMALYSYNYCRDKDYYIKVMAMNSKLRNLCKKYKYILYIQQIPLTAHYKFDWDEKTKKCFNTGELETDIDVYTECSYVSSLVQLMEDPDSTKLEQFIFNPYSFAILGGDEYNETYRLAYEARQQVDYPYDFLGDEDKATWGTTVPDYWDADHIPDEDWWDDQPMLPWNNEDE